MDFADRVNFKPVYAYLLNMCIFRIWAPEKAKNFGFGHFSVPFDQVYFVKHK